MDRIASRQEVVKTAREYLGTPFKHQGRLKGIGLDCAGLIICVAQELNLTQFDYTTYGHLPHARTMEKLCAENLEIIPFEAVEPGDVLLMAFINEPQHLGIRTDIGIIHCYAQVRRCVEHSLNATWINRIRKCYQYKGMTDG